MYKDFTENTKIQLAALILQSGSGRALPGLFDQIVVFPESVTVNLCRSSSWADRLGVTKYINKLDSYEAEAMEKCLRAKATLEEIFDGVWQLEAACDNELGKLLDCLAAQRDFIRELTDIMSGSDIYDPGQVKFRLSQINSRLDEMWPELMISHPESGKESDFADMYTDFDDSERLVSEDASGLPSYDLGRLESLLKSASGDVTEEQKREIVRIIADLAEKHEEYLSDPAYIEQSAHNAARGAQYADAWRRDLLKGAYYDDVFISVLKYLDESGQDKASFGAALLSFDSSEGDMELLGAGVYGEMKKAAGFIPLASAGLTGFIAELESLHSTVYLGKIETGFSSGVTGKTDFGKYKLTPALNVGVQTSVSAAQAVWADESALGSASARADVGNASVFADAAAGFYAYNDDGHFFSPCVKAEVGAGVSAIDMSAQGRIANDYIGVYAKGEAQILEADARAGLGVSIFDEEGRFSPSAYAKLSAEVNAAEVSGSAGLVILGANIGIRAGVSIGVGAHAEFGYTEGKLSMDVGAVLGVGVSLGLDIDVDELMKGVSAAAGNAVSALN